MKFAQRFLAAAVLLVSGCALGAGPAAPGPIQIRQPNGTTVQARIRGDEFQGWFETQDGYAIVQNLKTGTWEYGVLDDQGIRLQPSGHPAAGPAPAFLDKHLKPAPNADAMRFASKGAQQLQRSRASLVQGGSQGSAPAEPAPLTGTKKLAIILVNFSNRTLTTTAAGWYGKIFQTGAGLHTVTQFYRDNSFNGLDIAPVPSTQPGNPAGVITVTLPVVHPNYGNSFNYTTETAWLNLALAQAAPFMDFAALDSNGDGRITPDEAVFYFIPAGYETSGSAKTPSIWAHAWGGALTAGTKILTSWAMNGELNDSGRQHPMGVIAHELGHAMCGLPDLYDTSYANQGLGIFSLMSFGSWGADTGEDEGSTPVTLDAWCRQKLGWTVPVIPLANGQIVSLGTSLSGRTAAARLQNLALSSQETFLVENRYPAGWDRGMVRAFGPGWAGGLLVMHVDDALSSNAYVAGGHQMVMAEHADQAAYGSFGTPASLFYAGHNSLFSPSSLPDSSYYNGATSAIGMVGVSAPGTAMSFTFLALTDSTPPTGKPGTPAGSQVLDTVSFTWNAGDVADPESGIVGYHLQVGLTPGGAELFNGQLGNALTQSVADLGGIEGSLIYARVAAVNGTGLESSWSDPGSGLLVTLPALDAAVLDDTRLAFTTLGPWTATADVFQVGPTSARSAVIPDNGRTYLQTRVTGPGLLEYYWMVDSEPGWDFLTFSIDRTDQPGRISGAPAGFVKQSASIAAGSHLLRWTYAKDAISAPANDGAWVDAVTWTPPAFTTIAPASRTSVTGAALPYLATVANFQTSSTVNWTISNAGGVFQPAQTANGAATTLLASASPGTCTLTATPLETPNTPGSASLTLVDPGSVSVGLASSASTLLVNAPASLNASVTPLTNTAVTWTASGGSFSAQTSTSATWSAAAPGAYTITATSAEATTRSGSTSVTVLAAPSIGSFGNSGPVIQGAPATLSATFSNGTGSIDHGLGPVVSGVPVSTGNLEATTTYTLTVSNAAGIPATAMTTVAVVPVPATPVLTAPARATAGAAGLAASVPAQAGCSYAWTISNGTILSGQGSTAILFTAGAPGSLTLGCTVANAFGIPSAPGTFAVSVLPVPALPVITAAATVLDGAAGLTASVPSQSGCSYAWTVTNGAITLGQGTASIQYTAGVPGSLQLACTVTNGAGTGVSGLASATVVLDPGHITLAVDLPKATLPSGASLTLVGTTNSGMILWSLPAGQGSLGAARTASGAPETYTAPAGLMADLPVTVTLTSADNPAKSATAVLTVRSLNLNLDSALDLRDVLILGQDWRTSTSRSLLSGGAEVGFADLAILLAGLGF